MTTALITGTTSGMGEATAVADAARPAVSTDRHAIAVGRLMDVCAKMTTTHRREQSWIR